MTDIWRTFILLLFYFNFCHCPIPFVQGVIGTHADGLNFLIRDNEYNIMSAHDFPVAYNQLDHWACYPSFKEKVNRRILRFFKKME